MIHLQRISPHLIDIQGSSQSKHFFLVILLFLYTLNFKWYKYFSTLDLDITVRVYVSTN